MYEFFLLLGRGAGVLNPELTSFPNSKSRFLKHSNTSSSKLANLEPSLNP